MLDRKEKIVILLVIGIVTCLGIGAIIIYNMSTKKDEVVKDELVDANIVTDVIDDKEDVFDVAFEIVDKEKQGVSQDVQVDSSTDVTPRVEYLVPEGEEGHDYAQDHYDFAKDGKVLKHAKVALLSEDQAWSYVTGGLFSKNPNKPYGEIADELAAVYKKYSANVTVPVWYWANPDDPTDMKKTTKKLTFTVNSHLAEMFKDIFTDIYNHKSKPIINIHDAGFGTWVLRGINWSDKNRPSAHALGCAIDINPSSGSYNIDGVNYGNRQYDLKMPYKIWKALPETHTKYHVLYDGCPISEIFKSYGFYWGGDWSAKEIDVMHFAYLGDYGGRHDGLLNYAERRKSE